MGRGILFGAFWGFVVGGFVLAVASLLGDVPSAGEVARATPDPRPAVDAGATPEVASDAAPDATPEVASDAASDAAPDASMVDVPAGSEFDQSGVDIPLAPPASERPVDVGADAPLVTAPVAPAPPTLQDTVTAPASVPQTAGVGGLAPPPPGATDAGVALRAERPALEGTAPALRSVPPAADESAEADTDAAAPPVVADTEEAARPPSTEEAPQAALTTTAESESGGPSALGDAPVATANTDAPGAPDAQGSPAAPAAAEEDVAAATGAGTTVARTDQTNDDPSRPSVSAGGFGNRASGVVVNRPTEGTADADGSGEAAAEGDAAPPDPRAIFRHAATEAWEADDRPLFAIVLIDETATAARLPALASFDGPLTFAVPAGAAGAAEAVAAYRAAGHEVALLAEVPEGASPADVEVSMAAYLDAVPEAVAVMDGTFAGFRGDRAVAQQVAEIAAETGHGLLTFPQGLGTAAQVARQADVPVAEVFRDLDGLGQGNTVIRRFLDQAAFRAGQDGQVVLVGRLRAETISALLIWHQQDRAQRVNLAPLSATILAASGE